MHWACLSDIPPVMRAYFWFSVLDEHKLGFWFITGEVKGTMWLQTIKNTELHSRTSKRRALGLSHVLQILKSKYLKTIHSFILRCCNITFC